MLCFGEPCGKILKSCAPFEVVKERHFVYLNQFLRQVADLMVPGYGDASTVMFCLTCNDPEQRRLSRSVVSYKSDPALWGYEPADPVQDFIIFEIYLQFFYLYQFLLPPG